MPDHKTKNIPLSALRFAADLEMGSNGDGAKTVPVKLKARSTQPVDHWYFGRIVHDLAGMSLGKPRLAIDYCHNAEEVMGFANKFETEGGLVASGALTPFDKSDRASEVIFKSAEGVPYEASIFFDPADMVLEYVPQGMAVPVNGFSFEGPGVVARKWTLRGLAVCPYGQDKNTAVEFSAGNATEVAVKYTETEAPKTEQPPAEEAPQVAVDPAKVDDIPAVEAQPAVEAATTEEVPPPAVAPVEVVKLGANDLDGQAFLTAFGDKGGVWFAQGKSFADCQTLFANEIKADRDRLTQENQQLRTQLSATRGEREPVSFGGEAEGATNTSNEPTVKQKQSLGSSLAKFAANINFQKPIIKK